MQPTRRNAEQHVERSKTLARLLAVAGVLVVVLLAAACWRWSNSAIEDDGFALKIEPTYPQAAVLAGIQGRVVVSITVGSDGRLLASSIRSSSGSTLLDDAALDAARESRYRPATLNGIALQRSYVIVYIFALDR